MGEIDLAFEFRNKILVFEVSTQREERNEKIHGFFAKWSSAQNLQTLAESVHAESARDVFRIYVDLSRKSENREVGEMLTSYRDPSHSNGLLFEDDISYFEDTWSKARVFARYDMLSFLGVRPSSESQPVSAIRFFLGGNEAFSFVINADTLLNSVYAFRRRGARYGYQRFLSSTRVKQIEKRIVNGGLIAFPNSILINMAREVRFAPVRDPEDCPHSTTLEFPMEYCSSRIIDGQHRLMGIARLPRERRRSMNLQVIAFSNIDPKAEVKTFVDINNNQVKVDKSLVLELLADFEWPSGSKEFFQRLAVQVAHEIQRQGYAKIYFGGASESREGKIYLATFVSAFVSNNLIGGRFNLWAGAELDNARELFKSVREGEFTNAWLSYIHSNKGLRLLARLLYLIERNRAADSIGISNRDFVLQMSRTVDNSLLEELGQLYGGAGVRIGVEKVFSKLKGAHPRTYENFVLDLRSL